MPFLDVRLRVQHPCPYCDLSVAFPRTLMLLWGENRRDVLLLSSPSSDELGRVLQAIEEAMRGKCLARDGAEALVALRDYLWDDPPAVTRLAENQGMWVLPPTMYFAGKETYHFVAPSRASLKALTDQLRRVGEVELLSVRSDVPLSSVRDVPASGVHFFEGLTDRQARSLLAALEQGLLDVPARAGWDQVARSQGLSRSTFGEHLRKAQHRIISNSYAALKTRVDGSAAPEVLTSLGSEPRDGSSPLKGAQETEALQEQLLGSAAPSSWRLLPPSERGRRGGGRKSRPRRP